MNRTRNFLIGWLSLGFLVELITIFDGVPNNTFSHVVTAEAQQAPWLAWGVSFCFVACLGHWFLKKWPWRRPVWKDDPATPEDESLRN